MMYPANAFRLLSVVSCATVWGLAAPTVAQITPDATLGDEGSLVTSDVELQGDLADLIEGGARRGSNLFHSFVEFNVGEGQRVYFASPESVESILSRVTGGNPSNIFGTLGVDGSADLFLLNPNGVVFGENASLDISGSFYVTTAEAISLGPGVFSAVEPQSSSLLTVAPEVSFFNYLTVDSGDIASTAQLSTGADLTLAGQSVDLQGQVTAGENLFLLAQECAGIGNLAAGPLGAFPYNGCLCATAAQSIAFQCRSGYQATVLFFGSGTRPSSAARASLGCGRGGHGAVAIAAAHGQLSSGFSPPSTVRPGAG